MNSFLSINTAEQGLNHTASQAKALEAQLELSIERPREKDRNYHLGGRSFYFFDFDDNVAHVSTPLYLFHKETGVEVVVTSGEFAQLHSTIGKSGPFKDFEIRLDDRSGTFRCFRDHDHSELEKHLGRRQVFVEDIMAILGLPDFQWKGPSWNCFYHSTFNHRPVSIITARGHSPQTIKEGISQFVGRGFLPQEPNYLSIYPVSYRPTRLDLGDHEESRSVAALKQAAIRASVEKAFAEYGYSPHHRFGMSDDDPKNIQLIHEEMKRLKSSYPEVSFYIIETTSGEFIKTEVGHSASDQALRLPEAEQTSLFGAVPAF